MGNPSAQMVISKYHFLQKEPAFLREIWPIPGLEQET